MEDEEGATKLKLGGGAENSSLVTYEDLPWKGQTYNKIFVIIFSRIAKKYLSD